MYYVGQKFNTSLKGIGEMINTRNEKELIELAKLQIERGANMLGINCGTHIETEKEDLLWMAKIIQDNFEIPLCIDSLNFEACDAVLKTCRHGRPMLDALTCEEDRMETFLPLMKKYDTTGVCLLMDESGLTFTVEERVQNIEKLLPKLDKYGVKATDIYLDPLVLALSTGDTYGKVFLDTLKRIKKDYPDFLTCCGLDNISHGLPLRKHINEIFTTLCIAYGLDAVLYVPTKGMNTIEKITNVLLGNDEYCAEFLEAFRDESIG